MGSLALQKVPPISLCRRNHLFMRSSGSDRVASSGWLGFGGASLRHDFACQMTRNHFADII
jgi:hypothetical protein